jgi:hypothetical protein
LGKANVDEDLEQKSFKTLIPGEWCMADVPHLCYEDANTYKDFF